MSTREQQIAALEKDWAENPRWKGIKRGYSAADVVRLRGSFQVEHTLAKRGAEKLWDLVNNTPYVNCLGALTGGQAVQQAKAGIKAIETQSPHSVTVPGAIDGWATLLRDHGTKSFADVLAPAIEQAEKGWPVQARIAFDWASLEGKIRGNEGAMMHLLKDGRVPKAGEIMRSPALARTLRIIAEKGRDGFYTGEVAEDIVAENLEDARVITQRSGGNPDSAAAGEKGCEFGNRRVG